MAKYRQSISLKLVIMLESHLMFRFQKDGQYEMNFNTLRKTVNTRTDIFNIQLHQPPKMNMKINTHTPEIMFGLPPT